MIFSEKFKLYNRSRFFTPVMLFIVIISYSKAENPDTTLLKIKNNAYLIKNAAKLFDINPVYLAATICAERNLNYDWKDEMFDLLYVKMGQNGSIGFSQVKLKTAYFIELQLHDSLSKFFPGMQYTNILPISEKPSDLINKLLDDSTNILYAASYLKLIVTRWGLEGVSLVNRPEILGTLYSLGLFERDGSERRPHNDARPNDFGETVLKFIPLCKFLQEHVDNEVLNQNNNLQ